MRSWTKSNHKAFLALVRAGLWEEEVQLSSFGDIDYKEVYRLAEEQAVVGLVVAGFEHVGGEAMMAEYRRFHFFVLHNVLHSRRRWCR